MAITAAQLTAIMPRCQNAATWVAPLNAAMDEFQISANPERVAAFIGQIALESGELQSLEEKLGYSVERLRKVWPKRFPTDASAAPYARNPQALANFVYAGRIGNGDQQSGDGYRYRGRGLIQVTGRANYRSVGTTLGQNFENNPDALLEPSNAARSAAAFWRSHGCNELADNTAADNDEEDFEAITGKINPALVGLDDRKKYWRQARSVLIG